MENRKVSNLRCFAIAIAIAIASVFVSKNASAITVVPGQYTGGYKNTKLNISYIQGGQPRYMGWSNVMALPTLGSDYNNGVKIMDIGDSNNNFIQIPAKSYATVDLQIKTNGFQYFRVLTFNTNVPDVSVIDFNVNYAYQGYKNSQVVGDIEYNWNTVLITVSLFNSSDQPRNLTLTGGDQIMFTATNVVEHQINTWYFWCSAVNFYKAKEDVDTDTINENAQAEKQGRENINNQDKSGDDYGTGNKQESLLNAIKRFGEALTYKKGNCSAKIPAWGKISSGMTLDLCNTGVAMTGLSVILSVVAIFFFIPLAKSWLDTIIGLIREMQG